MKKSKLLIVSLAVLFLAVATIAIYTFLPHKNTQYTELSLQVFRKLDYVYLLDSNPSNEITYYRTSDLSKFQNYNEGDNVKVRVENILNINPAQKFMFGVKDYTVDVTKEITDLTVIQ